MKKITDMPKVEADFRAIDIARQRILDGTAQVFVSGSAKVKRIKAGDKYRFVVYAEIEIPAKEVLDFVHSSERRETAQGGESRD